MELKPIRTEERDWRNPAVTTQDYAVSVERRKVLRNT
jgi:hypothetical protein